MQLEQKEDAAQFKLKNGKASIQERQQRGLTWFPITITKKNTGFGGKVVLEHPAGEQGVEGLHLFQVGKNASLFSNAPGYSIAAGTLPALMVSLPVCGATSTKRVIDLETLTVPLAFF